jgi:hypothetical protein
MNTQPTPKKNTTADKPCAGAYHGNLTVTEVRPDSLLTAKCKCGYPAVVLPTAAWGLVLGCAACHAELAEQARVEAERDERERAAAERAERHEAHLKSIYYDPHAEDLSHGDLRLFRHLADQYQFDVNSVAGYLRVSSEEAWEAIQRLLSCNLLVEREKLPFTGVRPYRMGQSYAMLASPSSIYSVRPAAIRRMGAMEPPPPVTAAAPAAEVADPPKAEELTEDALGTIHAFIAEMCVTADGATESAIVLNKRYGDWCDERQIQPVGLEALARALEGMGHPARDGKRVGVRMKLARERAGR